MALSPLAALADFVRAQLVAVGGRVTGAVGELGDRVSELVTDRGRSPDGAAGPGRSAGADRAATVIVAASAPFAATAQARARLLRQLHASGLLTAREAADAETLLRRQAS